MEPPEVRANITFGEAFGEHGESTHGYLVQEATLRIPLIMQALRIDPALASPILVTTITDTFGYFIYLGLATLVLTRLI